jgi:transcription elongation factor Elf1
MPYKDKEKQRETKHRIYLRSKEKYIERNCVRRKNNKVYVENYKRQHCCFLCGKDEDVACKDLHHLGDKELTIAQAIQEWGLERLKKEIEKCRVVCANCHKKIHGRVESTTTNKKRITNRNFISEYRKTHRCEVCGESEELCLEFHHNGEKNGEISRAMYDWGIKRLKKEVSMCRVLCSNCHRKIHYRSVAQSG